MMKAFCAAMGFTVACSGLAAAAGEPAASNHRYLIERTFPAGALEGVDAAAKRKVNSNNKTLDVNWEKSYANADKTKTYCVYTGPSEDAVRQAAKLNGLPVDVVTEIPRPNRAARCSRSQPAIIAFSSSAMAPPACAATATTSTA